jgi:hypothetical protein
LNRPPDPSSITLPQHWQQLSGIHSGHTGSTSTAKVKHSHVSRGGKVHEGVFAANRKGGNKE